MSFSFAGNILDLERRELRRGDELIALEPQVFDLLAYLVANHDRVVSKDDLIQGVWGGRIVSDSALTTRINAARRAVGDNGAAQQVIRTIQRRGFRFVAPVTQAEPISSPPAGIRRLAAILAADIAGYSRLLGRDEEGTLGRLQNLRRLVIDPAIAGHRGRIVKTTGDGILIEFASVVDAVRCAMAMQRGVAAGNIGLPEEQRIAFRIGINLGDVVVEGDDILGDGVNIAARLEGIAEPGGICLSASAYEQVRDKIERAFVDLGPQTLRNIARPIQVYRVAPDPVTAAAPERLPPPAKPSIAVLPFQNLSGDSEQEYFADGMVEEIITALCRIRWLFVIARNSTLAYKGRAFDLKQVGRELGVRYLLDGSVRKGGNRVRITAQLIEAESGAHLWADRFDGALEDVFGLQDKAAISVAGVIEPTLQAAETDRSTGRPTDDLTAYDLYLRSYATTWSSAARIREALKLAEQAIARDPRYGMALAWAAFCCLRLLLDGRSGDRQADRRKGADYARRALAVAGDDPGTLSNAAQALAYFGEDIGAMMALVDRALALNPSYARGWIVSGLLRVWAGQPDLGIEHTREALRLSPRGRNGAPYSIIGLAHFFARRFDEAVPNLLLSVQEDPTDPRAYRNLAACYAHLGRLPEARAIIARVRGFTDYVIPEADYLRKPEDRELFLSGLRLASSEEE